MSSSITSKTAKVSLCSVTSLFDDNKTPSTESSREDISLSGIIIFLTETFLLKFLQLITDPISQVLACICNYNYPLHNKYVRIVRVTCQDASSELCTDFDWMWNVEHFLIQQLITNFHHVRFALSTVLLTETYGQEEELYSPVSTTFTYFILSALDLSWHPPTCGEFRIKCQKSW